MENSFFGFDTSIPLDDESSGGCIAEPSEEEYDALNDETFGSAINSDWEEGHENLVRLRNTGGSLPIEGQYEYSHKNLFSSANASGLSTPLRNNPPNHPGHSILDSDLKLNFSNMKFEDFGIEPESCGRINIRADQDERISQLKSPNLINFMKTANCKGSINSSKIDSYDGNAGKVLDTSNEFEFLRENISSDFEKCMKEERDDGINFGCAMPQLTFPTNAPKICTLEDIERNLIIQQSIEKHHHQQQKLLNDILTQSMAERSVASHTLQQHQNDPKPQQQQKLQHNRHPHQQQQLPIQQIHQQKCPPGFLNTQSPPRPASNLPNVVQHPLGNLYHHQQTNTTGRLLPGFPFFPPGLGPHLQHPQQTHPQLPPHLLLKQHGVAHNFPHTHPRPQPTHLPIALNNFAMHPNFNAMRSAVATGIHPATLVAPHQQPIRLPPPPPSPHTSNPPAVVNSQQHNSMYMFNMRLMQEIQQNHPLLQNTCRSAAQQQQNQSCNNMPHHQLQQRNVFNINHNRRDLGGSTGNLPPEEFDEYANLMSTRDKHWLIGIQLSQLNTDTPYIDDYYYTVYRERKAALNGNPQHSQAHKDNQMNHPLTQLKGHAQLVLVQLGNKNGTRNGQLRENRLSESGNSSNSNPLEQKAPYIFTPLKFENSLGKLQYGSVTAPRKIIDAEIMSGDSNSLVSGESIGNVSSNLSSSVANSKCKTLTSVICPKTLISGKVSVGDVGGTAQRKSRHILLHIETLYRIVLKLEDIDNPNVIATIIIKKKKENERIAALEQMENAGKTPEERASETPNSQSMNQLFRNKFAYEIEPKETLLSKLIAGLTHEKIVAMMNVRKGKALIRRIMPYIETNEICWNVWVGVFSSLQNAVKKDRDDAERSLYTLYPFFKKHLEIANFKTIIRISNSIPLMDKKGSGIFCSRFGISSLVCLILKAEQIFVAEGDTTFNNENKVKWRRFLDHLSTSLNRTIQNQTVCAAIESDSIKPLMTHFARFKDLKLDSLLALITEANHQIN